MWALGVEVPLSDIVDSCGKCSRGVQDRSKPIEENSDDPIRPSNNVTHEKPGGSDSNASGPDANSEKDKKGKLHDNPQLRWRLMIHKKGAFLLRCATKKDHKVFGAPKNPEYVRRFGKSPSYESKKRSSLETPTAVSQKRTKLISQYIETDTGAATKDISTRMKNRLGARVPFGNDTDSNEAAEKKTMQRRMCVVVCCRIKFNLLYPSM